MVLHQKAGHPPDVAALVYEQVPISDGQIAPVNGLTDVGSVASSNSEKPLALPYLKPSIVDPYGKELPGRGDSRAVVGFHEELDVTKVMLLIEEIALIVAHLMF